MTDKHITTSLISRRLTETKMEGDRITLNDIKRASGACDTSARKYLLMMKIDGFIDEDGYFDQTPLRTVEMTISAPQVVGDVVRQDVLDVISKYAGLVRIVGGE